MVVCWVACSAGMTVVALAGWTAARKAVRMAARLAALKVESMVAATGEHSVVR